MKATIRKGAIALGVFALSVGCAATSSTSKPPKVLTPAQKLSSQVIIDGSSTVFPITSAIAKEFQKQQPNKAQVSVGISGTTGGFKKFCAGETDISNASRPILAAEMEACNKNKVRYVELPVAYDALTIAVHPQNTWAQDITVAELKKIWEPSAQRKITRWKQVRSSWPDRPLNLYGAGQESGTYDYFTEAIVGKVRASRIDYVASEDDEILVEGVSRNPNALGYFGLSYYEENQDKVKALAIDNGKGAVMPSRLAVEQAQYQPLSRPLFIYVNVQSAQVKPAVVDFVNFYIKQAPDTVKAVGYVPLPAEGYDLAQRHFYRGKVGTVFEGQAQINLTIGELLRKQAKF